MVTDKPKILIVDDEEDTRDIFSRHLKPNYNIDTAISAEEAILKLKENIYHIVMTDLVMPRMGGIELLAHIKEHHPHVAVIVISGKATISMALEAIKEGAEDFIEKPVEDLELINIIIDKIMKMHWQSEEIARLRDRLSSSFEMQNIIGNSLALQQVIEKVRIIAPLDTTVTITGETGVGKEVIAEMIYRNSKRKNKKYVTLNCGSLPETLLESNLFGHKKGAFTDAVRDRTGYFQEADGGTLLLDEITETSLAFQIKLLRVLEKGVIRRVGGESDIPVDVRIIAATNKNFQEQVAAGTFREDLFYRLNVINIHLPPLRQRTDDIPVIAQHFVNHFAQKHGKQVKSISDAAMSLLLRHEWKGNVRELKNAVEHSVILSQYNTILPQDLPATIYNKPDNTQSLPISSRLLEYPFMEAKDIFEKNYLEYVLRKCKGDVTAASSVSGIKRQNLYEKFNKHEIDPNDYRN